MARRALRLRVRANGGHRRRRRARAPRRDGGRRVRVRDRPRDVHLGDLPRRRLSSTGPPGPAPACSPPALASAADPAGLLGLAFTAASCADGWPWGPVTGTVRQRLRGAVRTATRRVANGQHRRRHGARALPRNLRRPPHVARPPRFPDRAPGGGVRRHRCRIPRAGGDRELDAVDNERGHRFPRHGLAAGGRGAAQWRQPPERLRLPVVGGHVGRAGLVPPSTGRGRLVGTGEWYGVAPGSPGPTFVVRGVYPNWSARIAYTRGTWHLTP